MWHEARKQERKIRGMLVDYRRRAERRRDFYERIKADPKQFLQLHGRQCKIHLDPAIAAAADSSAAMMPWQGHKDNLIDRFDVRAHLDIIPTVNATDVGCDAETTIDDRLQNYERYRIIAQNSFLGVGEEKFLKQLHLEEQFGYTEQHMPEPKKKKTGGVAIGFNYDDSSGVGPSSSTSSLVPALDEGPSENDSDSDLDVDLAINISKIDPLEANEMNRHGRNYGMSSNDFYSFLTNDLEEAESFRQAKEEEHEKALFAGRKSRRERRAHREKRLANRTKLSPPSYAAQASPRHSNRLRDSRSVSKSPSPDNSGKITFITSFGGDDEQQKPIPATYADKVKYGSKLKRLRRFDSSERAVFSEKKQLGTSSTSSRSLFHVRTKSPKRQSRSRERTSRKISPCRSESYRRTRSSSSSSASRRHRRKYRRRSLSRRRSKRSRRRFSSSSSASSRSRTSRSRSRSPRSRVRSRSPYKRRSLSQSPLPRNRGRSPRRRSRSLTPVRKRTPSVRRSMSVDRGASGTASPSRNTSASNEMEVSKAEENTIPRDTQPALRRYYGRKRSDFSSESSETDKEEGCNFPKNDGDNKSSTVQSHLVGNSSGNSITSVKDAVRSSTTTLSLQERLKRKRQALINKQFKADKKAEQIKTEREKQEQQIREDELREMAIKLRRRHREIRHAVDSDEGSGSRSNCSSYDGSAVGQSRSESTSPVRNVEPEVDSTHRARLGSSHEKSRNRKCSPEGSNECGGSRHIGSDDDTDRIRGRSSRSRYR